MASSIGMSWPSTFISESTSLMDVSLGCQAVSSSNTHILTSLSMQSSRPVLITGMLPRAAVTVDSSASIFCISSSGTISARTTPFSDLKRSRTASASMEG